MSRASKPIKNTKGRNFGSAANAIENSGMAPDPEFDDFDAWDNKAEDVDPDVFADRYDDEFVTTTFDTPQGLQRRTVPAGQGRVVRAGSAAKPNKFAGKCRKCGLNVEAGRGLLGPRENGRWSVEHDECPKRVVRAGSARKTEAPDGFHMLDGLVYKVQIAYHGSGKPYAKLLKLPGQGETKGHWEYVPGAVKKLNDSTLLSKEQAVEFGKLYGICCICGAVLTNETSIEAGIGPVCAGREW